MHSVSVCVRRLSSLRPPALRPLPVLSPIPFLSAGSPSAPGFCFDMIFTFITRIFFRLRTPAPPPVVPINIPGRFQTAR